MNKRPENLIKKIEHLENIRGGSKFYDTAPNGGKLWQFCLDTKIGRKPIEAHEIAKAATKEGRSKMVVTKVTTQWARLNKIAKEQLTQKACELSRTNFVKSISTGRNQAKVGWNAMGTHKRWLVLTQFQTNWMDFESLERENHPLENWPARTVEKLTNYLEAATAALKTKPPRMWVVAELVELLNTEKLPWTANQKEPLKITLQHIGTSQSLQVQSHKLRTKGCGTTNPGFHLAIEHAAHHGQTGWFIRIATKGWDQKLWSEDFPSSKNQPGKLGLWATLDEAKRHAEEALEVLLGRKVQIDSKHEKYSANGLNTPETVEFKRARYEPGSNTVRSVPENYCLIAWKNNDPQQPVFDIDKATINETGVEITAQWKVVTRRAHQVFLNLQKTDHRAKEELAWLVSEWRKYGINT